jgi:hypothetical protein
MHQVSKRSLAALGVVLCLALPPALACSSTPQGAVCGVGTKLVNGACVPDIGAEAGVGDGAIAPDGAAESDAGIDGDAGEDDTGPDEPCPVFGAEWIQASEGGAYYRNNNTEAYINCDPECGTTNPACRNSRCETVTRRRQNVDAWLNMVAFPDIVQRQSIRLPRDPWTAGGECDPDIAPRMPERIGTNAGPYQVMSPQPRYSFSFRPSYSINEPGAAPAAMRAGKWAFRYTNNSRITTGGTNYGFSRLEPLFDAAEAYGPIERDRTGCEEFDLAGVRVWPPRLMNPEVNSPSPYVVLFTHRRHIAATTIILSRNQTCGTLP